MKKRTQANLLKWGLLISSIIVLISLLFVVFGRVNFDKLTLSSFFYNLGKLAGLLGFLALGFLIFLGDTARFFDRFFGLDTIIRFNKRFALVTMLFVLFHPTFFILSNGLMLNLLIPDFAFMPSALGVIALYTYIAVMLASLAFKRISYKIWQAIHIMTYSLFFMSLYHAVFGGSDSGAFPLQLLYVSLSVAILVGALYRVYYKLNQRKYKFLVKDVKWETEDAFTLVLKTNKRFMFKPGQFCFLRLNKDKLHARHPFTVSSSPKEKDLHFTIKMKGRFTKAASELKEGDEVIVEGPFGVFTIEDKAKDLVLIAGGVGITPFMSMIRDRIDSDHDQNILLLYGSKTAKNKIFKKELDAIDEDWLRKVYSLSGDDDSLGVCERGHIDKSMISKYVKDFENALFYISGPERMKDCVKTALIELGVRSHNIIVEDFFW